MRGGSADESASSGGVERSRAGSPARADADGAGHAVVEWPRPPKGPPADPGDRRAALADLWREEYRHLVRLAVLLVDRRDLAEEIVQEAFVKLDRAWDRVDDQDRRPAYLRSIVCNLSRSGLRRRRLARRVRPEPQPDAAAAEHHAMLRDDQRAVLDALATLSERQRQCLVLRFYDDGTETQIAEALGISVGSVKTHLHRGLRAMAERLEERA